MRPHTPKARRAFAALHVLLALSLLSAGPAVPAARPAALFALTEQWRRCPTWYCETGWYASPAVADIDGDGQPEMLWGGHLSDDPQRRPQPADRHPKHRPV